MKMSAIAAALALASASTASLKRIPARSNLIFLRQPSEAFRPHAPLSRPPSGLAWLTLTIGTTSQTTPS